jgi:plasmid stabilization system protein ParE
MSETIEKTEKENLERTEKRREKLSKSIVTLAEEPELFGRRCYGLIGKVQDAIAVINKAAETMRIVRLLNTALAENSTVDFGEFLEINDSVFEVKIDPETGIRRFVEDEDEKIPF